RRPAVLVRSRQRDAAFAVGGRHPSESRGDRADSRIRLPRHVPETHRPGVRMRLYILRALVKKEMQRHLANRGGLALAFLLVAAAVLLSVFNPGAVDGSNDGGGTGMVGGVHTCVIEYAHESTLTQHLRKTKPDALRVVFNPRGGNAPRSQINYSPGTGA